MLSDLLQIYKRVFKALADGSHSSQSCALELLALEKTLTIFDKTHIVTGDCFDQRLCRAQLSQSNPEVAKTIVSVQYQLQNCIPRRTLHRRGC